MTTADLTLYFAIFNSLAVPLMLHAYRWTRRVEKRIARLERMLDLDPLHSH